MMGKFMLFQSFCWKKDAREAKWFMPGQQETSGGLGGCSREASMSQGFRKETLHWPILGRPGREARFQSQRAETF